MTFLLAINILCVINTNIFVDIAEIDDEPFFYSEEDFQDNEGEPQYYDDDEITSSQNQPINEKKSNNQPITNKRRQSTSTAHEKEKYYASNEECAHKRETRKQRTVREPADEHHINYVDSQGVVSPEEVGYANEGIPVFYDEEECSYDDADYLSSRESSGNYDFFHYASTMQHLAMCKKISERELSNFNKFKDVVYNVVSEQNEVVGIPVDFAKLSSDVSPEEIGTADEEEPIFYDD